MAVPFPDIDPYEVMGVKNDDAPPVIKKAYYKLCLKFHPDKLSSSDQEKHKETFQKIQFSYSILSDPVRRKRFDASGSVEEFDDGGIPWDTFFKDKEITKENIELDKKDYQGSEEEREDILECFVYYDGDFLKLFECIPHSEITEQDEKRLFGIVQELIESGDVSGDFKKWKLYSGANRSKRFKKFVRDQEGEAEEAEELLQEIYKKNKMKNKERNEDSLMALIQNKRKGEKSAFEKIFDKYSKDEGHGKVKSSKGKGKKRSATHDELDDAEFEKIQAKIMGKKSRK